MPACWKEQWASRCVTVSLLIPNCSLFPLIIAWYMYQICQGQPYSHVHHVILNRNQKYHFTYWCLPTLCSGFHSFTYKYMLCHKTNVITEREEGKIPAAESPGKEENEVHPTHPMLPRERCDICIMWMTGPTKSGQGHHWSSLAVFHLQETSLQVKYSSGHDPVIGQPFIRTRN